MNPQGLKRRPATKGNRDIGKSGNRDIGKSKTPGDREILGFRSPDLPIPFKPAPRSADIPWKARPGRQDQETQPDMSANNTPPIKRRLISIMMFTSSVVLLLACGTFFLYDMFTFRNNKLVEASLLADVIGSNSTAAISFNDPQIALETLSALRSQPHVMSARIYLANGVPFATYVRQDVTASRLPAAAGGEKTSFGDTLTIFRGIFRKGDFIGSIFLEMD